MVRNICCWFQEKKYKSPDWAYRGSWLKRVCWCFKSEEILLTQSKNCKNFAHASFTKISTWEKSKTLKLTKINFYLPWSKHNQNNWKIIFVPRISMIWKNFCKNYLIKERTPFGIFVLNFSKNFYTFKHSCGTMFQKNVWSCKEAPGSRLFHVTSIDCIKELFVCFTWPCTV